MTPDRARAMPAGSLALTLALALALAAALLLAAAAPAAAQEEQTGPDGLAPVPEPPPLPERVESGEPLEPDVRIIQGERKRVTEYRVNGRLTAVKVEPEGLPAYYLVDTDGDGRLDTRTNRVGRDLLVPHWVLFSW